MREADVGWQSAYTTKLNVRFRCGKARSFLPLRRRCDDSPRRSFPIDNRSKQNQFDGVPLAVDVKSLAGRIRKRFGPMSAGEIAKWTGFTAASVTDLVDRLERKGFVRRASDPADRRRVMIEPVAQKVASARRHFEREVLT
jgi:hypothetical protein